LRSYPVSPHGARTGRRHHAETAAFGEDKGDAESAWGASPSRAWVAERRVTQSVVLVVLNILGRETGPRSATPKALWPPAQGWSPQRPTLGSRATSISTPTGLCRFCLRSTQRSWQKETQPRWGWWSSGPLTQGCAFGAIPARAGTGGRSPVGASRPRELRRPTRRDALGWLRAPLQGDARSAPTGVSPAGLDMHAVGSRPRRPGSAIRAVAFLCVMGRPPLCR